MAPSISLPKYARSSARTCTPSPFAFKENKAAGNPVRLLPEAVEIDDDFGLRCSVPSDTFAEARNLKFEAIDRRVKRGIGEQDAPVEETVPLPGSIPSKG